MFSKFLPVCDAGFGLVVVFVGSGSDAANTLSARPCVFVVCVTSQRVAVAVATALKPKARIGFFLLDPAPPRTFNRQA